MRNFRHVWGYSSILLLTLWITCTCDGAEPGRPRYTHNNYNNRPYANQNQEQNNAYPPNQNPQGRYPPQSYTSSSSSSSHQNTNENHPSSTSDKQEETYSGISHSEKIEKDDSPRNPDFRPKSYVDMNRPRSSKPINYQFTQSQERDNNSNTGDEIREDPDRSSNDRDRDRGRGRENNALRQDRGYRMLAQHKSTKKGSFSIILSSTFVGATLGLLLAKATHNILPSTFTSMILASLFLILSLAKFKPPSDGNADKSPTNPFSLFVQTLGFTLVLLMQRTSEIRTQFPTRPHLSNMIRPNSYPRRPFPPISEEDMEDGNDNPWRYQLRQEDSVYMEQYSMIKIFLSMAFLGAICGGNLPLIPTWIGGLLGAAVFCYWTTLRNSKGDLGRTMAMKLISLLSELMYLNDELGVLKKSGVVLNIILDKLLILDRKHSIRDRVTKALRLLYGQIMGIVNKVRADVEGKEDGGDSGSRRDRDRDGDGDRDRGRNNNNESRPRSRDNFDPEYRRRDSPPNDYRSNDSPSPNDGKYR